MNTRIISMAFIFAACLANPAFSEDTVATVNGQAISQAEFDKDWTAFVDAKKKQGMPMEQMTTAWEESAKRMLLDKLIEAKLVAGEAKKRAIPVAAKDLEAAISQVKAKFRDAKGQPLSAAQRDEAFKKELAKQNISETQFKDRIKDQLQVAMMTNQIVKEKVKAPAEEQIKKLYDAVAERLTRPDAAPTDAKDAEITGLARYFRINNAERVRIQHIVFRIDAKATAEQKDAIAKKAADVKGKLDKGANFGDMARQFSDDKGSAKSYGDAGYIVKGEIKELDDVLFSLPVGGTSSVMKTKPGLTIFRILEKKAPADFRYEAARKYLAEQLARGAAQMEYARFVDSLKKAAAIDLRAGFAKQPAKGG